MSEKLVPKVRSRQSADVGQSELTDLAYNRVAYDGQRHSFFSLQTMSPSSWT